MREFPCNKCGLCCQRVSLAAEVQFLDRGDGVCRYYDSAEKACSIYEVRPDVCRVDWLYSKGYSETHSWDDYVSLNVAVCNALQAEDKIAGHG